MQSPDSVKKSLRRIMGSDKTASVVESVEREERHRVNLCTKGRKTKRAAEISTKSLTTSRRDRPVVPNSLLFDTATVSENDAKSGDGPGLLDGLTLFRFAHMSRDPNAGGVEACLRDLNRELLLRNRMRILQTHLVPEMSSASLMTERIGLGELIWMPTTLGTGYQQQATIARRVARKLRRLLYRQSPPCHTRLLSALGTFRPDLAAFHWISEDSEVILDCLKDRGVPYVAVNHFQNTRLSLPLIQRQVQSVRAIGGVSEIDVPLYARTLFTNLSDGINTDFFSPERALPLKTNIRGPFILLPSRVSEGKGHIDALRALVSVLRSQMDVSMVFAGPTQERRCLEKLQEWVKREGLNERVVFTGELGSSELRNWYAASDLIILPSYSEGLGRVLLEAQSMKKAIVAYNVGGIPEALIDGVTGYLVEKGDIGTLAERITTLLRDRETRHEMGERAREFVLEHFAVTSFAERHEKFYLRALHGVP